MKKINSKINSLLAKLSAFAILAIAPLAVFAQPFVGPCPPGSRYTSTGCLPMNGIEKLIYTFYDLLNSLIPLLITLGLVYFIWGVVRYVIADGEEAKDKGKDTMIYGIIGFAVIVGVWGLVNILVVSFDLKTTAPAVNQLAIQTEQGSCAIGNNSTLKDVLCYATRLINDSVIPFIFALATVFFVWGAVKFFILNADEEAQRDQGRQFMIWGVLALAVMLSVWGLVKLVTITFGVPGTVLPQVKP